MGRIRGSRICRTLDELIKITDELKSKGIKFYEEDHDDFVVIYWY